MKPSNKNKSPIIISLVCIIVIAASVITCQSVNGDSKANKAIATAVTTSQSIVKEKEEPVTVLVAGIEDMNDDVGRADSIFLAKWDPVNREVSIISLCRDLYVEIPGYADNKLNAAFHNGGLKLLKQTIENNFNAKIDYTISVNYDACEKIIDAIGGVPVTLTEKEAKYLNETNYISKKSNRNLHEGECLLNGNQALGYSRVRYVSTVNGTCNDFGRIERLQGMLQAILNKLDSLSLLEYSALVREGFASIETDLRLTTCLSLIESLEKEEYTYSNLTVPVEGSYQAAKKDNKSVILWDKEINQAAFK